jgi:cytochrome P450
MTGLIDLWIQRLHEHGHEPLDIVAWYNWLTFDIIGDLAFGESFQCVEKARYHEWISQLFPVIKISALLQSATALPGGTKFLQMLVSVGEKRSMHMNYTTKKIERRLKEMTDKQDFMSYILKERGDGNEMSIGEMRATSFELILAGSETTANLLSGVTNPLLSNPDVLGRLEGEVRGSFSSESEINITGSNLLSYLSAVLDEALRIYPPVAFGGPRFVPKEGKILDGKYVAAGVSFWCYELQYAYWAKFIGNSLYKPPGYLSQSQKLFHAG